jgi:hypothetical protein
VGGIGVIMGGLLTFNGKEMEMGEKEKGMGMNGLRVRTWERDMCCTLGMVRIWTEN